MNNNQFLGRDYKINGPKYTTIFYDNQTNQLNKLQQILHIDYISVEIIDINKDYYVKYDVKTKKFICLNCRLICDFKSDMIKLNNAQGITMEVINNA